MNSLQLTETEQTALTEKVCEAINTTENTVSTLHFEDFPSLTLYVEHDTETDDLILSLQVKHMAAHLPQDYLGCPTTLHETDSEEITQFCDELSKVIATEYNTVADISRAKYTIYNWADDIAWYIYETPLNTDTTTAS